MPRTKKSSKRKGRKEAVPVLGVVGVSLSLASSGSAATGGSVADVPSMRPPAATPHEITLNEEEISDVSLATFYVFDKETAGTPRLGQQLARGCRCGCGGCRGCRRGGCGGCGCGGCGCCWQWGYCRVCY